MDSLVVSLGFPSDAKLVIVNCDDLGSSAWANSAIYRALREGSASSATIMMPCPAAADAAAEYDGEPVGVHLTLTAEWESLPWRPLTDGSSLRDARGGFPQTVEALWDAADLAEARAECRAQIEAAVDAGIDVTHLDSHMGTLQLRQEYFEVYVDLAAEYQLPLRMVGASIEGMIGFRCRDVAAERGVVFPDHFVYSSVGSRAAIEAAIADLRPGVTEVYVHPAIDAPGLRESHPDWAGRVDDLALLESNWIRSAVEEGGGQLVSFAALRDLQRRNATDR